MEGIPALPYMVAEVYTVSRLAAASLREGTYKSSQCSVSYSPPPSRAHTHARMRACVDVNTPDSIKALAGLTRQKQNNVHLLKIRPIGSTSFHIIHDNMNIHFLRDLPAARLAPTRVITFNKNKYHFSLYVACNCSV